MENENFAVVPGDKQRKFWLWRSGAYRRELHDQFGRCPTAINGRCRDRAWAYGRRSGGKLPAADRKDETGEPNA